MEVSPFGLIHESDLVRDHPWRILVVCIMCNRAMVERVRDVLPHVLKRWGTVDQMAGASERQLASALHSLGLQKMRARRLIAMSKGWMEGIHIMPGRSVIDLEGVGQYGADAYAIFIEGRTDLHPKDVEFQKYLEWRLHGEG